MSIVPTIKTEPSVRSFESPDQFSQSKLKFMNTLVDKTKEEKFAIDINVSVLILFPVVMNIVEIKQ